MSCIIISCECAQVVEGGAADRAGMLVGDVMTAINGQTVRAMNQEEVRDFLLLVSEILIRTSGILNGILFE